MILVTNPALQTLIFTVVLFCCLLISIRPKKYTKLFPKELTTELKGLAILLIIFSHIGYILSSTDKFLWPLSTMAGVGVNLFLFLSGYGLTVSSLKKKPTIKTTLLRLLKLYVPLVIVLLIVFVLDYVALHRTYPNIYMAQSFIGLFLNANANSDVNSVLWYFTLVLFYYLLFPILLIRKHIWISALLFIAISSIIVSRDPAVLHDVMRLYQVHTLAFPLGMIVAWLANTAWSKQIIKLRLLYQKNIKSMRYGKVADIGVYVGCLTVLAFIIGYSAIHSGVEQLPLVEQTISLATMLAIILFFILKRFTVGALTVIGFVSFEIYLLHWPLVSRYDLLYIHMAPWLATALYLVIFVILGYGLQKVSEILLAKFKASQ